MGRVFLRGKGEGEGEVVLFFLKSLPVFLPSFFVTWNAISKAGTH
jgi:hypothetical protein